MSLWHVNTAGGLRVYWVARQKAPIQHVMGRKNMSRKEGRMQCIRLERGGGLMPKVNGTHQLWCCRRHPQTCVNCIVPERAGKLGGKSGAVAPCYFDVPTPIHLSSPLLFSPHSTHLPSKGKPPSLQFFVLFYKQLCIVVGLCNYCCSY